LEGFYSSPEGRDFILLSEGFYSSPIGGILLFSLREGFFFFSYRRDFFLLLVLGEYDLWCESYLRV
jgi:hypothetical protein